MNESFVQQLNELGYFRGMTPEDAGALREEIVKLGWLGLFSDAYRLRAADAEDLAEGGIGQFIAELEPFLTAEGVTLPEIEDNASIDGYVVNVGGIAHPIYDAADLELDAPEGKAGIIWGLSMTRGFAVVDELLTAAGSEERVYAVNGGNDLFAYILTPELQRVIMEHPDASRSDGPYKPTEEYPWFGQPHLS